VAGYQVVAHAALQSLHAQLPDKFSDRDEAGDTQSRQQHHKNTAHASQSQLVGRVAALVDIVLE